MPDEQYSSASLPLVEAIKTCKNIDTETKVEVLMALLEQCTADTDSVNLYAPNIDRAMTWIETLKGEEYWGFIYNRMSGHIP